MRLKDKVAIITGAGSGIGKATALLFGREGAKVVCADVNEATSQAAAREIVDAGGQAESLPVDVSVAASVEHMVKTTVERHGRLDILVNNAGIIFLLPIAQVPEEMWDRLININLKGVYLGTKYAVPHMIRQGSGAIVNTASIAGLRGFAMYDTYCASKGGVVQLTKATAVEYARMGVRINCVCPGIIETGMLDQGVIEQSIDKEEFIRMAGEAHPMGRIGQPEEVANCILFLASDEASFVVGHTFSVDGGLFAGNAPEMPPA